MTRQEAKQIALNMVNDGIAKYGCDAIYVQSPCVGKCSWTYKEALTAIINDTNLENTNTNIIDAVLEYYEYLNEM